MLKAISKVIKILIYSDFVLNSAWGLLGPVFAIFIVKDITGGSAIEGVKVAGFASLSYWIVKSLLQIPIGKYLDKNHGEIDDFWFMVVGLFLTGFIPFGFIISSVPWHIYILHTLYGAFMAMVIPSWSAIFTRHIDRGKEAYEWGLRSTFLGMGAGIAGALGGIMAAFFGFKIIFILVGSFTIVSSLLLLVIRKEIISKCRPSRKFPYSF
jgi:DHA1 family multidrug resistance protein-like MFS transporter